MGVVDRDLSQRTFEYAVAVKRVAKSFLERLDSRDAARQLQRASASIAANYRAAGNGRSRREFIAKLGIAIEEADETILWLDYLAADAVVERQTLVELKSEGEQIRRILRASRDTATRNERRKPPRHPPDRRRQDGP